MRPIDLREAARAYAIPTVEAGPLAERARRTWHARMQNEYGSSRVFRALAAQLWDAGFDRGLVAECAGFALEEERHGAQCGAVVTALGGRAVGEIDDAPSLPPHVDAPLRAAALRNVISVCCMSETVAVSLIGAERVEMPASPMRDLLTRIYSDEVGHARFGWRLLASVTGSLGDDEREAIDAYLPVALAHLEAHELAHLPAREAPPGGEAYGLCSGNDARELLYDTIEQIIVPRLADLGFAAREAWPRSRAA